MQIGIHANIGSLLKKNIFKWAWYYDGFEISENENTDSFFTDHFEGYFLKCYSISKDMTNYFAL